MPKVHRELSIERRKEKIIIDHLFYLYIQICINKKIFYVLLGYAKGQHLYCSVKYLVT